MTNTSLTLAAVLTMVSAVTLVGNDKLEGKPLITPTLDKTTGAPKTDLLGKEIGSIRLEQESRSLNGTYMNTRKRVAFISGPIEDLNKLLTSLNLKEGSTLAGKIVVTESLNPFWNGQTSKINPETEEAIGITVNGTFYPVYMKQEFVENTAMADTLIRTPEAVNAWIASYGQPMGFAPAAQQEAAPAEAAGVPTV